MAQEKTYTAIRVNKGVLHHPDTLDKLSRALETPGNNISKKFEEKVDYTTMLQELNQKLYRKVNAFNATGEKSQSDGVLRLANGLARDPFFISDIAYSRLNELGLKEPSSAHKKPFANFKEAYQALTRELYLDNHNTNELTEPINVDDDECRQYKKKIIDVVKNVRERQFLTDDWDGLIVGYLANPVVLDDGMIIQSNIIKETLDLDTKAFRTASVNSINDKEITITFKRNIQRKDYVDIWDKIKNVMTNEPLTDEFDLLRNRLTILHEYKPYKEAFNLSYQTLAKIYFPEYFTIVSDSIGVDVIEKEKGILLVRQIIKRNKDIILNIH